MSCAPPCFGQLRYGRRFVCCTKMRKHFTANMEEFYCFTDAIGFLASGNASTTMKTKGRRLQRACKSRWLSNEAAVRAARSAILRIRAARKQLSGAKNVAVCIGFLRLVTTKNFIMSYTFANIATLPDRTERSVSGRMFQLCTDEIFCITVYQYAL